ncbi:TnsA endonuclease N-terminal domain-containing protein [Photobacterium damselae]|uniref:TnsA endonuclease N-terminal domain-containing protein n=1 Tax=Photobacterium damselae TaxID=38293 RepID=UPI000D9843C8|nr:TnsA endonuclease N-terminal domain-containing protein [Photobacterium damselae]NVO75324.1 TnsA endonuclease N-terminal domain-containing protein [Photobacterium damselae subsp. damselae]SPY25013.1 TnsA endonuclease N terminal [Photobacterium damselae]
MYIRNLRKPSPNKNIYKFSSLKNQDVVMCESRLERDCCYHFEYDLDVVQYESQPEGFCYDFNGKKRPYTPDFLVTYHDGTLEYVEVKPYSKTLSKTFKQEFSARKEAANRRGFCLVLVTDKQIRDGYFLKNVELVHRYSGCIAGDELTTRVYSYLIAQNTMKISDLADSIGESIGRVFASVLRLIAVGKAGVDLDIAQLSESTTVSVR